MYIWTALTFIHHNNDNTNDDDGDDDNDNDDDDDDKEEDEVNIDELINFVGRGTMRNNIMKESCNQ